MSTRFWVQIPGADKPVDMSLDELAERHRKGKLLAGTLAVKVGGSEWKLVEELDEVKTASPKASGEEEGRPSRPSFDMPPPSLSAQGVDMFEQPPSLAPTLLGAPPAQVRAASATDAGVPPPPPPPRKRGGMRWLAAVMAAVLVIVGGGASALCVWYRFGYTHGAVFEHLPDDCAVMEYVDFGALDASPAMREVAKKREKSLVDWLEDLDDEEGIRRSTDDDARGRAATLRRLVKLGVQPYGDVKEVGYCEVRDDGGAQRLLVIGGAFRGRDLLGAIRDGLLHRDRKYKEDKLKIDDVDGRPYLKIDDDRWATMATSQVVLIGPKRLIERYVPTRAVARAYAMHDGDAIVRRWTEAEVGAAAGQKDAKTPSVTDERYTFDKGGKSLTFHRTWTTTPGSSGNDVTATKEKLKAMSLVLRKEESTDLVADALENAEVRLDGAEVSVTISFSASDLSKMAKTLAEADVRELRRIITVLKPVMASELFHHMILPGVDYFELRLSPW